MASLAAESKSSSDPLEEQAAIVVALRQLANTLKDDINFKQSAPQLSHYRTIPQDVAKSYEMMQQGAVLIHATSTKYTLMGKLDATEQTKMCRDLLQGCQYAATGCLAIHNDVTGCSRSARHHARRCVRAVVNACINLIQSFVDGTAVLQESQIGAQKTGAVWECCENFKSSLPIGNRNAMRRDLLTYKVECNETLTEFQQIIDAGPALIHEQGEGGDGTNNNEAEAERKETKEEESEAVNPWEAFLDGQEDQYTVAELPIAIACLFVIKCSRGCLNASLQAMEAVGDETSLLLDNTDDKRDGSTTLSAARLSWISKLHDLASAVGDGMTDLGACMYPPLNKLDELQSQVERQVNAVEGTTDHILDCSFDLIPQDVVELASKVKSAIITRRKEALEAIAAIRK